MFTTLESEILQIPLEPNSRHLLHQSIPWGMRYWRSTHLQCSLPLWVVWGAHCLSPWGSAGPEQEPQGWDTSQPPYEQGGKASPFQGTIQMKAGGRRQEAGDSNLHAWGPLFIRILPLLQSPTYDTLTGIFQSKLTTVPWGFSQHRRSCVQCETVALNFWIHLL